MPTPADSASPRLHHVTASFDAPQPDLDIRAGALRPRFVRRSVSFDGPGTYHMNYAAAVPKIAADPPGLAVDEAAAQPGEAFKLPEQFGARRERIDQALPPIRVPA